MVLMISAQQPQLDSPTDDRFGRSTWLVKMDTATNQWEAFPNPGAGQSGGAGVAAAQFVINQHVDSVISGDFGPNAYNALQAANIAMYLFGTSNTINNAIEQFKAGKLECVSAPTSQGHHLRG